MIKDKLKDVIIKLKSTLNKRVKEISSLQIENIKLDEENKNTMKIIEEILNDPKTSPELNYSVNKFINNAFSKTGNSFYNSSENKEKTILSVGEENLSQVFSSKLTGQQYMKLKDVCIKLIKI